MMNIVQDGDIPHDPSEISDSDSLDNEIEENRNITHTDKDHAYSSNFDLFGSPSEMENIMPTTI